ncbi:MAG: Glu/Leu/Phe/Val dehydrogenase [Robiginitomaculum sp.]|nr:Glu/Leu/Phe/Val dehydrogenase [Robiginitomaculum sp.]
MAIFENIDFDDHESVHTFSDPESGLKAFIAIHSTKCGPSAGGCRLWSYSDSATALTDALRLSRGMSYKNAMAGLNLGGGKAVVLRPSGDFDRTALFAAFGKAVDSLGGRYYTAEDVGVSPDDMRVVRQQTSFVAGLNDGEAASGDPSPVTADGVFRAVRLAADKKLNAPLKGLRISVQGLGHVGYDVCRRLSIAGAHLIVTDINAELMRKTESAFGAKLVAPDDIYGVDADIYVPCALGATINENTIDVLKIKAIAGAANNQLSISKMGKFLHEKSILYCPDYVVNGGGIINIAGEIEGNYNKDWVEEKLQGLEATLVEIIECAAKTNRPTNEIADEMAQSRIGRR